MKECVRAVLSVSSVMSSVAICDSYLLLSAQTRAMTVRILTIGKGIKSVSVPTSDGTLANGDEGTIPRES